MYKNQLVIVTGGKFQLVVNLTGSKFILKINISIYIYMSSSDTLNTIKLPYRLDNNKLLDIGDLSEIKGVRMVDTSNYLILDNNGNPILDDDFLSSYGYSTDSIGYKYINKKNVDSITPNNKIFYDIVIEHIQNNLIYIPQDIETIKLTGLKFGDVIGGGDNLGGATWHKKTNRPLVINEKDLASLSLQSVIDNAHTDEFNYDYIDIDLCSAILSLEFKKSFDERIDDFGDLIMEMRALLLGEEEMALNTKNDLIEQIHAAHENPPQSDENPPQSDENPPQSDENPPQSDENPTLP